MVSKVNEATKKMRKQQEETGKENQEIMFQMYEHHQNMNAQQQTVLLQCNKGKASKFKRSSSNLEEDGVNSAILLLAAIVCTR
ncbi:hypothetical protein DCAR_0208431 [Daucus carota subsp. sativus]|uniref:Uncharacterized protein n=1 Tax=Daucus carota subsp. sativus TaxID=79200 RepID=A0A162AVZ5_DAUCS|nr:hypothetical protein DCAR_0208431 [Daucus carota subsp. sativus]